MENKFNALQAHEIATNWQENKCNAYVDEALVVIKERASKGYFTAYIENPHPDNINKDGYIEAMKNLGFSISHTTYKGICWEW